MYGGQASLGRACADLFQQARLNTDCKINFPGWVGVGVGVVGLAENKANSAQLELGLCLAIEALFVIHRIYIPHLTKGSMNT